MGGFGELLAAVFLEGDAGLAQIAQVLLVLLDLRIAVFQAENDGILVVHVAVAEPIDLEPVILEQTTATGVILVARFRGVCPQHDVPHAHLLDEGEVVLRRFRRDLRRDFDARLDVRSVDEHRFSPP